MRYPPEFEHWYAKRMEEEESCLCEWDSADFGGGVREWRKACPVHEEEEEW